MGRLNNKRTYKNICLLTKFQHRTNEEDLISLLSDSLLQCLAKLSRKAVFCSCKNCTPNIHVYRRFSSAKPLLILRFKNWTPYCHMCGMTKSKHEMLKATLALFPFLFVTRDEQLLFK